jgi:hypothetical protein
MCDYSLVSIPNRLAREGEELIAHRFCTGTIGFAPLADIQTRADSPGREPRTFWSALTQAFSSPRTEPVTAVCIPPGASLLLRDVPTQLRPDLAVGLNEEVTFTQMTSTEYRHRDAVRFRNGHEVLLQQFREGQRARVLALSLAENAEPLKETLVSVR